MTNTTSNTVPPKWDATHIQSLANKTAIVTGANSGIGYVTALELARKGAHVVLACRSEERGKEAEQKLIDELSNVEGAGKVEFMKLDVSSQSSVKEFSQAFLKTHDRLDLLINNAGIGATPYTETVDGFEIIFATNHLGHFALTAQLFDLLKKSSPSRIVNVSSMTHYAAMFDEDEIMPPENKCSSWMRYVNSKLCNILFTMELNRRLEAEGITGVTSVACHPGATATNIMTASVENFSWFYSMVWRLIRSLPTYQTSEMGALPTLYAATAPGVKGGDYYGPDGFNTLWGHPALEDPSKQSKSISAALKLWEFSERATDVPFPISK